MAAYVRIARVNFWYWLFLTAGLSAAAGEEEAAGGLCSASEGAGAAGGALHLLWARSDPAGAATGGEQVGGELHYRSTKLTGYTVVV